MFYCSTSFLDFHRWMLIFDSAHCKWQTSEATALNTETDSSQRHWNEDGIRRLQAQHCLNGRTKGVYEVLWGSRRGKLIFSANASLTIEQEDYLLCLKTQLGLNAGVYSQGILNPSRENGVLCQLLRFCYLPQCKTISQSTKRRRSSFAWSTLKRRRPPATKFIRLDLHLRVKNLQRQRYALLWMQ